MATSISTYCGEHLWAAPKRSLLGYGGPKATIPETMRPASDAIKQTTDNARD
jgi:hypothetical protein